MGRLSTATRTLGVLVTALAAVAGVVALAPGVASAEEQTRACTDAGQSDGKVLVVTASGLLDPVLADFIEDSIDAAEAADAGWLVLQMNIAGTVVPDERVAELIERVRTSEVPVAVWVGPSGAKATEGAAQLAAVACSVGVAPGSHLGDLGEPVVDPARFQPAFREALPRIEGDTVDAKTAQKLGLARRSAPVIGSFVINLDGVETKVVKDAEGRSRRTIADSSDVVFAKLGIGDQLLHTVASPPVAYLLLLAGLSLIVFELYTAGVGIAGVVGAGCTVLGCYGLGVLPARGWAVALLVAAVVAYAVDVQTGVPRAWTAIGTVALVLGSLFLYEGLTLSWITLLVGIVGMLIFVIGAMPAMVRTRFSTPTIGRDWMIGEEGIATTRIDPEGVVQVRGAGWRARTNRATPVPAGDPIRVVEVDGLLLEVEPLEGAARDHRERRSRA